jgi:hypothetical protein
VFALFEEFEDGGSVFLFCAFAGGLDHLEIYFILDKRTRAGCELLLAKIGGGRGMLLTCPIRAMVKPANAPPLSTSAAATLRYSHKLGSSGGFGCSAVAAGRMEPMGAAKTDGI